MTEVTSDGNASQHDNAASVALTPYQQLLVEPAYRLQEDLNRYATPVLVAVADVSNALTLVVILGSKLTRSSPGVYLAFYSLANLLSLNFISGADWLCFILRASNVANLSKWSCSIWTFLTNVLSYCGVWVVVALTMDRCIFLCCPRQAASMCSAFAARTAVTIISVLLVVVSVHAMWLFELTPVGCYISQKTSSSYAEAWLWASASLYTYFSLSLLFFLTVTLAIRRCRDRKRGLTAPDEPYMQVSQFLSAFFFLLTAPAIVVNLLDILSPQEWISVGYAARMELAKRILSLLPILNQALPGYLLLLTERIFHTAFLQMFARRHMQAVPKSDDEAERGEGCLQSRTWVSPGENGQLPILTTSL